MAYIVIQDWMISDLQLKGNELLIKMWLVPNWHFGIMKLRSLVMMVRRCFWPPDTLEPPYRT